VNVNSQFSSHIFSSKILARKLSERQEEKNILKMVDINILLIYSNHEYDLRRKISFNTKPWFGSGGALGNKICEMQKSILIREISEY
jgi:hypothetical protein